jgi:tetratricopeptide (TPR) repeat protein
MMPQQQAIIALSIFFSYAHEDETLRDELRKQLSVLRWQGIISEWYDRNIQAGNEWEHEIHAHLATAQIILLLISPDFLASRYCYSIEMMRALERHLAGEARVIPIILRPVDWEGAPFSKLEMLPTDAHPVTSWSNRDAALLNVAKGIRKAIEDLNIRRVQPQPSASSAASTPAPTTAPSLPWNVLPHRNPFFTGRAAILADLHKEFTSKEMTSAVQPQAISGLGGIGKTQIALEYAYRYRNEYRKVPWARAGTAEELATDFVAMAHMLNLPEHDAQDQRLVISAVKRWLETNSGWLFILDNVETLALVRDYVPLGTSGHMLLTTRAQSMSGLARKVEIDTMELEDGALFLLRRAGIIAQDAPLDNVAEADQTTARAIVQAMEAIPLALDQAGAYMEETECGLSHYLMLYRKQHAKLLNMRGGFVSGHPEAVATTWSLTFANVEQADIAAVELLRLCAFLAPDAIPEEILTEGTAELGPVLQPVAADLFDLNLAIGELLKYSLLRRDPKTQTLSIHQLVQVVLRDEMDEDTQRLWAERTVKAVNRAFPDVAFEAWPRCERLLPHAHVCAGLIEQWNFAIPEAARLLNQAGNYLTTRAQYSEAEPLLQRALAIRKHVLGSEHPDTAETLNNLANLYYVQGNYEQAEPLYQQGLSARQKALGPEHPDVANSLYNLATLYRDQGKYEQAETLYQQALTIWQKALGPEHPYVAFLLKSYANLLRRMNRTEEAVKLEARAQTIRAKQTKSM